jgi:hypothetical protein
MELARRVVIKPGMRIVETAYRIREMAATINVRQFGFILNKSTALAEDREFKKKRREGEERDDRTREGFGRHKGRHSGSDTVDPAP